VFILGLEMPGDGRPTFWVFEPRSSEGIALGEIRRLRREDILDEFARRSVQSGTVTLAGSIGCGRSASQDEAVPNLQACGREL